MTGVLLVADQSVVQWGGGQQYVGQGTDGSAGVAENFLNALAQHSFHQNLGTGHFHGTDLLRCEFRRSLRRE